MVSSNPHHPSLRLHVDRDDREDEAPESIPFPRHLVDRNERATEEAHEALLGDINETLDRMQDRLDDLHAALDEEAESFPFPVADDDDGPRAA